jgi:predicted RNA-binding protein associated with RNAse of E/G family
MPVVNPSITVIKRDLSGREVWRYDGVLLRRGRGAIILEAHFDRLDTPVVDAILRRGDRFLETYYTHRWYNIFEIHDREDDRLKGWYCNIGKPAVWEAEGRISYVDLALDLWVSPNGTQTVLDEDEFAALALDAGTRSRARAVLEELKERFRATAKS